MQLSLVLIPDISNIPDIEVEHAVVTDEEFLPYLRDEDTGSRPWAIPGTPGLEHRVGGLEKTRRVLAVFHMTTTITR